MDKKKSVKDLRFDMLFLLSRADLSYVELLRFFPNPTLAKNVLQHLIDEKLISGRCESTSNLHLTKEGELCLALLQDAVNEQTKKDADERKRQRAQEAKAVKDKKKQFRHDFAVAAFSVALTLLVEHFHEIAGFLIEFFRSLG